MVTCTFLMGEESLEISLWKLDWMQEWGRPAGPKQLQPMRSQEAQEHESGREAWELVPQPRRAMSKFANSSSSALWFRTLVTCLADSLASPRSSVFIRAPDLSGFIRLTKGS